MFNSEYLHAGVLSQHTDIAKSLLHTIKPIRRCRKFEDNLLGRTANGRLIGPLALIIPRRIIAADPDFTTGAPRYGAPDLRCIAPDDLGIVAAIAAACVCMVGVAPGFRGPLFDRYGCGGAGPRYKYVFPVGRIGIVSRPVFRHESVRPFLRKVGKSI